MCGPAVMFVGLVSAHEYHIYKYHKPSLFEVMNALCDFVYGPTFALISLITSFIRIISDY